jgi:hypothetical protein
MRLAESMAQQKAYFKFEFVAKSTYGKMEFNSQTMTDPYPMPQDFDPHLHYRIVYLSLAPRLVKYGTSEGTNFEACTQLLEEEVETRGVSRSSFGYKH